MPRLRKGARIMPQLRLNISAATCEKAERKNQDNLLVDKYIVNTKNLSRFSCAMELKNEKKCVFCVSDGIGGQHGGDVASEKAILSVYENLEILKNIDSEHTIVDCMDIINSKVIEHLESQGYDGGATLSGIIIADNTMWAWNIGDSPIYLYRNKKLRKISEDHTLNGNNRLFKSDRKRSYSANVLTKYIGNNEESGGEQVKIEKNELKKNDIIVICTDGVVKGLSQSRIKNIIKNEHTLNLAEELVDMAHHYGADDDITAIVVRVEEC